MVLNVSPSNVLKKATHAANFVSNVNKIENPVAGGQDDNLAGNYIYFDRYPQSDASGATKDPIRWRILDNNKAYDASKSISGNGMPLYSDIALDAKQYHSTYNSGNFG